MKLLLKILVFSQSQSDIETAREAIQPMMVGGVNSKIVSSVKEFEEEVKQHWNIIYLQSVYKGKFILKTDSIIYL